MLLHPVGRRVQQASHRSDHVFDASFLYEVPSTVSSSTTKLKTISSKLILATRLIGSLEEEKMTIDCIQLLRDKTGRTSTGLVRPVFQFFRNWTILLLRSPPSLAQDASNNDNYRFPA